MISFLDYAVMCLYRKGLLPYEEYPVKEVTSPIKEEKLRAFIIVDDRELNGLDVPEEIIEDASNRLQEGIQKEIDSLFASLQEQRLRIIIEKECQAIRDRWWQDFIEKSLEALGEKKIGRIVYSSNKISTRFKDKL